MKAILVILSLYLLIVASIFADFFILSRPAPSVHHIGGGDAGAYCSGVNRGCAAYITYLINQDRSINGAPPLTLNWTLGHCATAHSKDMAAHGYIFHNPGLPDIVNCGVPFSRGGQNVGEWPGTKYSASRSIYAAMMAEQPPNDGHRRNILDPSYTTVGIGYARGTDGNLYLTMDFIG